MAEKKLASSFQLPTSKQPMVAIVGSTASGKSDLALYLAKKYNGEIICADSRTIYKAMDIGTAKPSLKDQKMIPHHCLDIVTPDKRYSVAEFKKEAEQKIKEINSRHNRPFIVGGSGLYIDALLYDFEFEDRLQTNLRQESLETLQSLAIQRGLQPTQNTFQNKRHLAGFLERGGEVGPRRHTTDTVVLGIVAEREILRERIEQRINRMFKQGIVEETKALLDTWGKDAPGLLTLGYHPIVTYLNNEISAQEAKDLFIRSHVQFAKRQMTWFKRNKDIQWVSSTSEAEQIIEEKLAKFVTMKT